MVERCMRGDASNMPAGCASLPPLSILRGSDMATLVTVHGTGATGEECGPKWWQKTSAFEKSLRDLIQASDGPISYEQLIWDGNNSETSRRTAARNQVFQLCDDRHRAPSVEGIAPLDGGPARIRDLGTVP